MKIAFVVRDELMPIRNGYHSTGVNLLRQLAELSELRCIHLGANATLGGPTATWCASAGIGYEVIALYDLPLLDGSAGVVTTLRDASKQPLQNAVKSALRKVDVGATDERTIVFTTGWDAISDVVASIDSRALCFPADSITLFEKRRLLSGTRTLLRPARVALASWRERRMLRAGYEHISYVTDVDANLARSLAPSIAPRVITTPIGINPIDFAATPSMADRIAANGELLLFSGTLAFLPNRDAATRLATHILPRITRQSARVRLVGAGGELLAALAGPRLEIAGWVPSLITELQRATLFVAPVRMGAGAKNNVLQALAAGTPVIGSASCFFGFAKLPPGAIVCESDDDFVREIEALLNDATRLYNLSKAAQAFALNECTWRASAERLVAHFGAQQ
jgi:glycosyltransferase involved in cell wall biosynthesis